MAPNTIPTGAKAGGNYLSGQLIAREARRLGFGEGIALASTGLLSEGAGENIFLVFDGALHTTPVSAALLNGITRNSLITLARDAGIEVVERDMPREYLYLCDELFMCGTAAEVTPIRSVDGRQIGAGKAGTVTRRMQEMFFGLFDGTKPDKHGWLELACRAGRLLEERLKPHPHNPAASAPVPGDRERQSRTHPTPPSRPPANN